MFKRFMSAVMIVTAMLCFTFNAEAVREPGNGEGRPEKFQSIEFKPQSHLDKPVKETYNVNDEWLIYWYICGTNLETNGKQATNDIEEAIKVQLPSNVKILIQTGTTSKWHHSIINTNGRYVYDDIGLRKISNYTANMYEPETLISFLKYGEKNYNADHRILIFWDHGGVGGVCWDQEVTKEILNLNSLRYALEKVYGKSPKKIPFEIIGFDTCLMASYECANNIDGFAKYMVASEASENSLGWYYTDWLTQLVEHPESNGLILGEKICSGSLSDCIRHNEANESTFSILDMSQLPKVRDAHQRFFTEALNRSKVSKNFATTFDQMAKNIWVKDYDNTYIDLRGLAEGAKNLKFDTSNELITAIDTAIVGEPSNGSVYRRSGGLSTYYPYNKNWYQEYKEQNCALQEQKDFYDILLDMTNGSLTSEHENSNAPREQRSVVVKAPLSDVPISVDEDKHLTVQLTPEQLQLVSSVRCMVMPSVEFANSELGIKDSALVLLGNDVDFKGDWQTGVFHDNFRGVWAKLDGHMIFTAVTFSNDEYSIYEVPIKLNGEVRTLEISYSYVDKKYSFLGARKKMERGISSRDVKYLNEGDEVTPLFIAYIPPESLDSEVIEDEYEGLKIPEGNTFQISENPTVEELPLPDGKYGYCFQFFGPGENLLGISQRAVFEIKNGEIVNTTLVENTEESSDIKSEEMITE